MMIEIPCVIMRGGTSKGLFFMERDLPKDRKYRYELISKAFGSPDPTGMQINGLGGTAANMNKLAIISKREGESNAVNYDFGQIDIGSWIVDTRANCGNISSAVGPFAVDYGLVDEITEPITKVKIFNINTQKYIVSHVPVRNGKTLYEGDYRIAGVNRPGSKIRLDFLDPGGATTGKLLPTGKVIDVVKTEHFGEFEVSCVDAANPFLFVRARDLGLSGGELPQEITSHPDALKKMLEIRAVTAVVLGFAKNVRDAHENSPAVPKFCMVAPATDYRTIGGDLIRQSEVDVVVRMLSMGKPLPALAITGSICIGVASKIKGAIVQEALTRDANAKNEINIGHPSGLISMSVDVRMVDGAYQAISGTVYRTARKLMCGTAFIPE
ncbi:MAG: PrpF domain-containing protein [Bacillota bacterium]|jgi:hypothetical protein